MRQSLIGSPYLRALFQSVLVQIYLKLPGFKTFSSRTWYSLPLRYPALFWYDPSSEGKQYDTYKIHHLAYSRKKNKFWNYFNTVFEYFSLWFYQNKFLKINPTQSSAHVPSCRLQKFHHTLSCWEHLKSFSKIRFTISRRFRPPAFIPPGTLWRGSPAKSGDRSERAVEMAAEINI